MDAGIKNMKPPYKLSVGSLYICFATDIDSGVYDSQTYKLDTVKKVGVTENGSSTPVYASGKKYDTVNSSSGTELAVDQIAFPDELVAKMRGETVSSKYGSVKSGASNERPYFMAGYVEEKSNGVKKFVQYPKCQLTENTNDIETKEDTYKEQSDTYTFSSSAFDSEGNDKFTIQTDNEKFPEGLTEELFFSKVIRSDDDIDSLITEPENLDQEQEEG